VLLDRNEVVGEKSPKGVGKEQDTLPLNPFVMSLSKGECGEFRHPASLFPLLLMPIACLYLIEFK